MQEKKNYQKTYNRIQQTVALKNIMKEQKPTVFIYTIDSVLRNYIQHVGLWMLGCNLKVSKKGDDFHFEQVPAYDGLIRQQINFDGLRLHVLENKNVRVFATALKNESSFSKESKLSDVQKNEQVNLIFFASTLESIIKENKFMFRVYAAVNSTSPTNEQQKIRYAQQFIQRHPTKQQIKSKAQIKQQQFGLIYCSPKSKEGSAKSKPNQLYIRKNQDQCCQGIRDFKVIFDKKQPNFSFCDLIGQKYGKAEIKQQLRVIKKQVEDLACQMLSPIQKLITLVLNNNQKGISYMSQQLMQEIRKLSHMFQDCEDLKQSKLDQSNIKKLDKDLGYKWLSLKILKLNLQCQKELRQNIDLSQWFQNLFNRVIEYLTNLPQNFIKFDDFVSLRKLSKLLRQQLEILRNVQPSQLYIQSRTLLASMVPKIEIKTKPYQIILQKSVLDSNRELRIPQNKSEEYYKSLYEITKQCEKVIKQNVKIVKDGDKLVQIARKSEGILVFYQIQTVLFKPCLTKQDKQYQFEIIKNFIINSQKQKKQNYDWSKMINIFTKCAERLRFYQYPELAIEIYKKLRFQNKIDVCIKQMLVKRDYSQEQVSDLNMKVSQYFSSIGNLEKAFYYSQLAYEGNPTKYMKTNIQCRKNLLEKTAKKQEVQELALISQVLKDQKWDQYYKYELPAKFIQELQAAKLLDQNELQTEASIEIDRQNKSYFQFYK